MAGAILILSLRSVARRRREVEEGREGERERRRKIEWEELLRRKAKWIEIPSSDP